MSSTTAPRNGLLHSWSLGESGWKTGMDGNLKFLDNFGVHLSVKDRTLLTPPGSPANGDTYILASGTLTGAWVGKAAGDIAMWSSEDAAWRFKTPRLGYSAYIENEGVNSHFVTSWQAGRSIYGYEHAPTPTAKTASATLTIAELLTKIITATSAVAVALTLPTGTLTDAGVPAPMPVDKAFDWTVINLGSASGAVTITAGAGHTFVGNAVVAIDESATFRTRKTAANTFVTYRMS